LLGDAITFAPDSGDSALERAAGQRPQCNVRRIAYDERRARLQRSIRNSPVE
jgi:hypothetical protein